MEVHELKVEDVEEEDIGLLNPSQMDEDDASASTLEHTMEQFGIQEEILEEQGGLLGYMSYAKWKRMALGLFWKGNDDDDKFYVELGREATNVDRRKQKEFASNLNVLMYILLWYVISISLHFYNTWLFSRNHFNFPFPLFTTMMHTVVQFLMTVICLRLPPFAHLAPSQTPPLSDLLVRVMPGGFATGLDLGLSNSSLKSISLSFYTMVKSGAPIFVILFAFLFGVEKPSLSRLLVVLVIVAGVCIMVANETKFNLVGYIEVQFAAVFSGLRWVLTQVLLTENSLGMNNPLSTNLYMTPFIAFSLLIAALILEGISNLWHSKFFETFEGILQISGFIAFGGFIVFFLTMAEYTIVCETSVVTFAVAGIVKEIITITASSIVFGDNVTVNMIVGLVISIIGIFMYSLQKPNKAHQASPISTSYEMG